MAFNLFNRKSFPLIGLLVIIAAAQVQPTKCPGKADVVVVLDSSTSVGEVNWALQLDFIKKLLGPLTIGGASGDRVALITYNTEAKLEFNLDKHTTLTSLETAISNIKFTEGITATGDALKMAREDVIPKARGDATKMLFLVTDGMTNFGDADPIEEATKLKASGVQIITIGITDSVNATALRMMSSRNEVNGVKEFSELSSKINDLEATTCDTKKKCKPTSKSEVIIVLDSSTSVGDDNWQLQLDFVNNVLSPLNIGPSGDRVAFVTYNDQAKVVFGLSKYSTSAQVANAVKNAKFSEGLTATGVALKLVETDVLPDARKGVPKILILVTDGKTNIWPPKPRDAAEALKKKGVYIISVGITSEIDEPALKAIASKADEVAKVDSFAKLSSLLASLAKKTCDAAEKA